MFETILEAAARHGCHVVPKALMSEYTTFKVGGPVDLLVEPNSEAALSELLRACKADGVRPMILGRGSNLLVPDEGLPIVVLHMGDAFSGISLTEETVFFTFITVMPPTASAIALMP